MIFTKEYRARKTSEPKPVKEKKRTPIKQVSKKLSKEKATYRELRLEFLSKTENMFCAVFPHLLATEIHHTEGKEGWRLNNTIKWLPVSREGHNWIHDNVALATERGFMGSRLHLVKPLNEE